jgi:hypothetical protein
MLCGTSTLNDTQTFQDTASVWFVYDWTLRLSQTWLIVSYRAKKYSGHHALDLQQVLLKHKPKKIRKEHMKTKQKSRKAELSTPRYKSIPRFQRQSVQNREMLCFLSRWQTFLTHICTKNTAYTVCTLRIVDLFVSADSSAVCVPTPTPSLSFPHWTRCAWPPEKWPTPPLLQCTCDHVCGGATSAVQLIQSIIEMSII